MNTKNISSMSLIAASPFSSDLVGALRLQKRMEGQINDSSPKKPLVVQTGNVFPALKPVSPIPAYFSAVYKVDDKGRVSPTKESKKLSLVWNEKLNPNVQSDYLLKYNEQLAYIWNSIHSDFYIGENCDKEELRHWEELRHLKFFSEIPDFISLGDAFMKTVIEGNHNSSLEFGKHEHKPQEGRSDEDEKMITQHLLPGLKKQWEGKHHFFKPDIEGKLETSKYDNDMYNLLKAFEFGIENWHKLSGRDLLENINKILNNGHRCLVDVNGSGAVGFPLFAGQTVKIDWEVKEGRAMSRKDFMIAICEKLGIKKEFSEIQEEDQDDFDFFSFQESMPEKIIKLQKKFGLPETKEKTLDAMDDEKLEAKLEKLEKIDAPLRLAKTIFDLSKASDSDIVAKEREFVCKTKHNIQMVDAIVSVDKCVNDLCPNQLGTFEKNRPCDCPIGFFRGDASSPRKLEHKAWLQFYPWSVDKEMRIENRSTKEQNEKAEVEFGNWLDELKSKKRMEKLRDDWKNKSELDRKGQNEWWRSVDGKKYIEELFRFDHSLHFAHIYKNANQRLARISLCLLLIFADLPVYHPDTVSSNYEDFTEDLMSIGGAAEEYYTKLLQEE